MGAGDDVNCWADSRGSRVVEGRTEGNDDG